MSTSLQKSRKRSSFTSLKAILRRSPDNQGKVVVKKPPAQKKTVFWRPWEKRCAKDASNSRKRPQALYNTDISIAVAVVICFSLAVLLLIVKEIGLTARHCVKWDLWTVLATGQRNSVVGVIQRMTHKLWEERHAFF
ncbi:LAFA_0E21198g1_1 [Lachancea sp. 'fantastica']|nr:LAFA_0E21198g1_1 [Lachancea sp. 'fantastica']